LEFAWGSTDTLSGGKTAYKFNQQQSGGNPAPSNSPGKVVAPKGYNPQQAVIRKTTNKIK